MNGSSAGHGRGTGSPAAVLVHGAWGSPGLWDPVTHALGEAGLDVRVADLPTMQSSSASLADDVRHVRSLAGDGPVVLVGHSYGGAVITEAGGGLEVTHLVYVASIVLDEGETFFEWLTKRDAGGAPLDFRDDGTAMVTQWGDPVRDGERVQQLYTRNPPRPFAVAAAVTPVSVAPWRSVPSTFLLAAHDTVIHPETQREVAERAGRVVELDGDHFVHGNHPQEVARLIRSALGG